MNNIDPFLFITLIFISYFLLLIILKKLNIGKKLTCSRCDNCCPDCKEALERIKRIKKDFLVNYLTFQMFDFKRYKCMNCAWEGIKWEKPFSGKF